MYEGYSNLESLDLLSFNIENVSNMIQMFSGCFSLKSLELSLFKTDKFTNACLMFDDCKSLESLKLPSFNKEKVKDMQHMFGCSNRYGIKLLNNCLAKDNKGKCKLIINKKDYDVCDYIEYDEFKKYGIN